MNSKEISSYRYARGCVALFAKAPAFGRVKTRMEGALGRHGALALHKALISYVFTNLSAANLCPVQVWVAADQGASSVDVAHDDLFLSLCNKKDILLQCEGDLGRRMSHAARHVLQRSDYVVLVGADCASVDAAYLEQALQALEGGESIVIGPAQDGGYVLLGLRTVPECLFKDIAWGEASVLDATRQSLARAGLTWHELEPRWDVDRPEDLERLRDLRPAFPISR